MDVFIACAQIGTACQVMEVTCGYAEQTSVNSDASQPSVCEPIVCDAQFNKCKQGLGDKKSLLIGEGFYCKTKKSVINSCRGELNY